MIKSQVEHLVSMFVLCIEVCGIDKPWCEYEPNQTTDYAVNPGSITSKTSAIKAVLKQCLTMAI